MRIPYLAFSALFACSGSTVGSDTQKPIEAEPEPKTEAVLVGPLCQGERCQCKQGEDDAGAPEAGAKRFEVKLGPSDDPLWATVDGMVLFKSREIADACFYIDLRPGEHKISVRGKGEGGLSVGATFSEMGGSEGQTWWYNTFDLNCGAPGQCDTDQVKAFKERVTRLEGKHDPCGSTVVKQIEWETGRMPDRAHPDDLLLRASLKVYEFIPKDPPGTASCDKSGAGEDEPATPP